MGATYIATRRMDGVVPERNNSRTKSRCRGEPFYRGYIVRGRVAAHFQVCTRVARRARDVERVISLNSVVPIRYGDTGVFARRTYYRYHHRVRPPFQVLPA